jgi:hypothetical protein
MEAKPVQANRSGGRAPDPPVEVAPPEQPTLGGGEHQPIGAALAVGSQVLGQGGGRHRRQGHGAPAGLGLGRPPGEVAVDLGRLLGASDPLMQQVDPLDPQADQFPPTQP